MSNHTVSISAEQLRRMTAYEIETALGFVPTEGRDLEEEETRRTLDLAALAEQETHTAVQGEKP